MAILSDGSDLRLQHIMANPISHGRYINFVAFEVDYSREGSLYTDPWISTVDLRVLSRSFSNWELDVQQIASVRLHPFSSNHLRDLCVLVIIDCLNYLGIILVLRQSDSKLMGCKCHETSQHFFTRQSRPAWGRGRSSFLSKRHPMYYSVRE